MGLLKKKKERKVSFLSQTPASETSKTQRMRAVPDFQEEQGPPAWETRGRQVSGDPVPPGSRAISSAAGQLGRDAARGLAPWAVSCRFPPN